MGERNLLRVYLDPAEIGRDGYPHAWHRPAAQALIEDAQGIVGKERVNQALRALGPFPMSIKDYIREQAGHRCERCGHPYEKGMGEWSPCDERCTHGGPVRCWKHGDPGEWEEVPNLDARAFMGCQGRGTFRMQAQWRILTVHHLNGIKHDCRWWNLTSLCQRCHLTIQGKVYMERPYDRPHTEWFRPHAAGYYAAELLGLDLTREEVLDRIDEILDTQLRQHRLDGL